MRIRLSGDYRMGCINMGQNRAVFNVVGAIVGALLGAIAVFGLVQQSSATQPQTYKSQINYDQ